MPADLTIDELARTVGMTARNVRSHQTRGLVPGPEMRGRVGYYGEEHVERLLLIKELQDEGLPLRLVERLLTERGDTAGRILALRRTVLAGLEGPAPGRLSAEELVARFGNFSEVDFQRAVAIGAIVPQADGSLAVPNPALLDTASQVVSYGISLTAALGVAQHVYDACGDAARAFVDMVRDEVWDPFDGSGKPEADWPRISDTIEQIRPLASQVFVQMLPAAIASEIERVFGEELRAQAQAGGR